MVKVITYGTYDLLHYGHISLLERAKALGDYLIVGVTADDFDKKRGKINGKQSLMERIEAIKALGIADEIIIEEYEGQKIDDIRRYEIDIFTVGSDWVGKFDYLNEYCKVVYLDRTQGVSSSEIRTKKYEISLGLVGGTNILNKYREECSYVNGIRIAGICSQDKSCVDIANKNGVKIFDDYNELLCQVDAVYIIESPRIQYRYIKEALLAGKHVLCESPIALNKSVYKELLDIAAERNLIFMEAIKTAYAIAYNRLLLLAKSGKIGKIVSVDATCTSLRNIDELNNGDLYGSWNSIFAWGPTAMLPIFQLLGTEYISKTITSYFVDKCHKYDLFTKIDFVYSNAVGSIKVGQGVKSEGNLIISGTKGYIYVPAPWWKTDYFEIRYENQSENRRYFYQLDGEGIRYEIIAFLKSIEYAKVNTYIDKSVSEAIVGVIEEFEQDNLIEIG